MPLVRAYYTPGFYEVRELREACKQIVPAAFYSPMGKLAPGSIRFVSREFNLQDDWIPEDVLIEIEAQWYSDRNVNLEVRVEHLIRALHELFPDATFALWPKLVTAGWATDVPDDEVEVDMSMPVAIARARDAIAALRNK